MGNNIPGRDDVEVFWENYRQILEARSEKEYMVLDRLGIPRSSIVDARSRGSYPNIVYVKKIASALQVRIEDFFKSPEELALDIRNQHGQSEAVDLFDIVPIPVFSQKVAAGNGQEA